MNRSTLFLSLVLILLVVTPVVVMSQARSKLPVNLTRSSATMTEKSEMTVIFHVDPRGKHFSIELINTVGFRGLQVTVSGFRSLQASAGEDLSGAASKFENGTLILLIKQTDPLPAGRYILYRVEGDFRAADIVIHDGMIVANEYLQAASFTSSIVYDIALDGSVPIYFNLYQNYPNPFNPTTKINYDVKELSQVRIAIYNILGQEVTVLINGEIPAGPHSIEWDGTDANGRSLSTGTYIYRMTAGKFVETKKMMFVK